MESSLSAIKAAWKYRWKHRVQVRKTGTAGTDQTVKSGANEIRIDKTS